MKHIKFTMTFDITDEGYKSDKAQALEADITSGEYAREMQESGAKFGVENVVTTWNVIDGEE